MSLPPDSTTALAEVTGLVAAAVVLAGAAVFVRTWAEFRARRRRQVAPLSRRHPGGPNILPFPDRARVIRRRP